MAFKKVIGSVLKILFAFGLIFYLIHKDVLDISKIKDLLSLSFVVPVFLLICSNLVINTYRWSLLLKTQGIVLPFFSIFKLSVIGIFFNYAIPGSIGGDFVKGYYLISKYEVKSKVKASVSILVDRLVGFYGMSLMAILVLPLQLNLVFTDIKLKSLSVSIVLLFLFFSFLFLIGLSRRVKKTLRIESILTKLPKSHLFLNIFEALDSYRSRLGYLLYCQVLSFFSLITIVILFYICSREMGLIAISFTELMFVVPLGMIAMAAPIAPAGVGVGQAAYAFLLGLFAVEATSLGAIAITFFQLGQLALGFFGLYYYLRFGKINQKSVGIDA